MTSIDLAGKIAKNDQRAEVIEGMGRSPYIKGADDALRNDQLPRDWPVLPNAVLGVFDAELKIFEADA